MCPKVFREAVPKHTMSCKSKTSAPAAPLEDTNLAESFHPNSVRHARKRGKEFCCKEYRSSTKKKAEAVLRLHELCKRVLAHGATRKAAIELALAHRRGIQPSYSRPRGL
jgi:hypothetical protein